MVANLLTGRLRPPSNDESVTPMHTRNSRLSPGQHVVITGGSSGLGLELAHKLAARGLRLTLMARDPGKLEAAHNALIGKTPGAIVEIVAADVAKRGELDAALTKLVGKTGGIDILVNSAGVLREGYFEDVSDEDFRAAMDINLFGTVNAIRAALPYLKASGGRIANIASVAGLAGVFGFTTYSASKHALVGFTNALRYELEPQGVSVLLVCPGEFDTPMIDALDAGRTPENREQSLLLPRLTVEQIAREVIDGLDAGKRMIIPGRRIRLAVAASRIAPSLFSAVNRRSIARVYRGPSQPAESSK